eukprot:1547668-Alexandrium_andersonii.AAC.1
MCFRNSTPSLGTSRFRANHGVPRSSCAILCKMASTTWHLLDCRVGAEHQSSTVIAHGTTPNRKAPRGAASGMK